MGKLKSLPALMVALLLLAGTGAALWLANFTANVTLYSDNTVGVAVFELGQLDLIAGESNNVTWNYTNPNAAETLNISLIGVINSSNAACHLTPGTDLYVKIYKNGYRGYLLDTSGNRHNIEIEMSPGLNVLIVDVITDPSMCPIDSDISITGLLV